MLVMFVVMPISKEGGASYLEKFKSRALAGKSYPSWAHVPAPRSAGYVVFRSVAIPEERGGSGRWQTPTPMFKSIVVDGTPEWVRIRLKRPV